eukprot:scaffold198554_cov35-Attheya_sp.AAC.1
MFEDLKHDDHFSKLLLPTDSQGGALNNKDYRYAACMGMYHTMGQVILNSLTQSSKKVITAALSPKAYSILLSNKNLRNGWDLLWIILRKASPHLGGTNLDVHDMITNLKIEPGESLAVFLCNHALQVQHTIIYSQTQIPETRLCFKCMTTLMTCGTIRMYIASQYADLRHHITQFGEHITYPVDNIQSIHEYLDTVNLDKPALYPDSNTVSGNKAYNPSPSPQPHIARVNGNRDIPSCECCLRRGHLSDTCFARGIHFLPPDIQRRVAQYNATHSDRPKVPPKASNHTPPVKYPSRSPHHSTVPKPNIKVLIGDLTDNDQLITDEDPEIFDFMDQEDEFVNASDTPAAPPSPTIKQMSVNYDIMPILPDYDGIFDPAELRLLQGN